MQIFNQQDVSHIYLSEFQDRPATAKHFCQEVKKQQNFEHQLFFNHQHMANRLILGANSIKQIIKNRQDIWADAVISDQTNILVYMKVADCLPIIILEPKSKVFALVHGGFKPLIQNILELTILDMQYQFAVKPSDFLIWIGPGIEPCCYQFANKPIVADLDGWKKVINLADRQAQKTSLLSSALQLSEQRFSKLGLDKKPNLTNKKSAQQQEIWQVNLRQFINNELARLGILAKNIKQIGVCTCCATDNQGQFLYHSHKRQVEERGKSTTKEAEFAVSAHQSQKEIVEARNWVGVGVK